MGMPQKPETYFKEKVLRDLARVPKVWAVKIQQVAIRGTPDILICCGGYFIALELKKDESSKTDKLQDYTLDKIADAGGHTFVAHPENWTGIFDFIVRVASIAKV